MFLNPDKGDNENENEKYAVLSHFGEHRQTRLSSTVQKVGKC